MDRCFFFNQDSGTETLFTTDSLSTTMIDGDATGTPIIRNLCRRACVFFLAVLDAMSSDPKVAASTVVALIGRGKPNFVPESRREATFEIICLPAHSSAPNTRLWMEIGRTFKSEVCKNGRIQAAKQHQPRLKEPLANKSTIRLIAPRPLWRAPRGGVLSTQCRLGAISPKFWSF